MDYEEDSEEKSGEDVIIEASLSKMVNYATQQNDIPIIHSLRITNNSEQKLTDVQVDITTDPAFAISKNIKIASIDSGRTYDLGSVDIALSPDFLSKLTERIIGILSVNVSSSEQINVSEDYKISLLAYDEWCGLSGLPEMLAAFVMPNHPIVEKILASAALLLKQWTDDSSLSGYQSKNRDRVASIAAAIYTALQNSGIKYINPPASFENNGQKIRTPDRIFNNGLGTCLDIAVTTAACLEQAGLNSLIIIKNGHAFAGVWLEDDCFADSASDDLLRLRKRVELGEICVFETTFITQDNAVPFEQAMNEGKRHLEDSDSFRCTIDICRSRKSGIRPLPTRSAISNAAVTFPEKKSDVNDNNELPITTSFQPVEDDTDNKQSTEETPASRLDRWKRKLLDLTLTNRLLNFRETKKTLPVLCPDLASLEDALADGNAFKVYPRPDDFDPSTLRDTNIHRLRTGDDAFNELIRKEICSHRLHCNVTNVEINRRLPEIYRNAVTSLEEGGANTLYLALGFLVWYESDNSVQKRLAPIILIPLDIERKSAHEGFSINQSDEDAMVNVTLLEMLMHDHEVSISGMDPIPQDEHGIDVKKILTEFRKAVKDIDRWEVIDEAFIAHFSFTKFLMWRDLEVRTDDIKKNKIVSHLINNSTEVFDPQCHLPEPDQLDDVYKSDDILCPMEADSSQLAAVCAAAKEGKSFVLHGPPGTGKSQTITNIIACALACGKSVLFISEKMAALNVVQRRLNQCGLGDFCLEVHSNKSHRKHIVEQLGSSLDYYTSNSNQDWQMEAERLDKLRGGLNAYVRALHQNRETGESLFQGISRLIGLRDVKLIPLEWPFEKKVDRTLLEKLRDTVKKLEVAASSTAHPGINVWSLSNVEDWSPKWRNDVEESLKQTRISCTELGKAAQSVAPILGMQPDGLSEHELRAITSISKELLDSPMIPVPMMLTPDWENAEASISRLISRGRHRDSLRAELYPKYTDKMLFCDAEGLKKSELACLKSFCTELIAATKNVSKLLGINQRTWNECKIRLLADIAKIMSESPIIPSSLMLAPQWEDVAFDISQWVEHGKCRDSLREKLYSKYTMTLLQLDLNRLSEKLKKADGSRWALQQKLGRNAVKRALSHVAASGQLVDSNVLADDIETAIKLRDEENYIANIKDRATELFGKCWADGSADWNTISNITDIVSALQKFIAQISDNNAQNANRLKNNISMLLDEKQDESSSKAAAGKLIKQHANISAAFFDKLNDVESKLCLDSQTRWQETKNSNFLEAFLLDIENADVLCDDENYIIKSQDQLSGLFGRYWNNGDADWNMAEKAQNAASKFRKLAFQIAGTNIETALDLRKKWSVLLSDGYEQLSSDGEIGKLLQDYISKAAAFGKARTSLETNLSIDGHLAWGESKSVDYIGTVISKIDAWSENIDNLRPWCHWMTIRHNSIDLGLKSLVDAYESSKLSPENMLESFNRGFYQWFVDKTIESEQVLRDFFSREFERKINQFREVDKRYIELTRSEIQARLAEKIPNGAMNANHNSEAGILNRERQKQRRHMPIRQLFQKIPNLLPRLKPCLLMSPMSVAQYLDPAHPPFDLVVFDEASQIPVWDAVGAIARGTEAVIVGDPKQLPPTNFFSRSSNSDDDNISYDEIEDLESILDDCLAARLPQMKLQWHYRSKHESLIAFSNYHYYENRLLTFPSPSKDMGISLRQIDGIYDKSKSHTNLKEANAIVSEVLRRLNDPELSKYSIGIVTFSISQQMLIEDLLDEARNKNPEIEVFFDAKAAPNNEPVFIKNLESVQGDERDIILFSVCYGPDAQGRVSMNFGPLNRDGGERRLNVAITRARYEIMVFSTLRPEQIDLSRTRAKGAHDLKAFLDYAKRGTIAIEEQISVDPSAECESIFEKQVCDALQNRGYTVHSQVGCSGYRIDLAIVDPENPGRYLLGIECDGANYHRAKTARDRDRLRESILKSLGWNIHRIWSTDWWARPADEIKRVESAIEQAKRKTAQTERTSIIASAPAPAQILSNSQPTKCTPPVIPTENYIEYKPYKISRILGDINAFYLPETDLLICKTIEEIVNAEGPVSFDIVARRTANCWEIGKIGAKVSERMHKLVLKSNVNRVTIKKRVFLWPEHIDRNHFRIFRVPGKDNDSRRNAADIPPEEIANAAQHIIKEQVSLPIDDLVSETARLFGFARTGVVVNESIRIGIDVLLKRDNVIKQDNRIVEVD